MRHKAQLLLLLMLLVWVEGNGNERDGTKSRRDERRQSKEESGVEDERDEYVYSEGIDSIRSKAVRIVPAPDLSKSEEGKWKDGDDDAGGVDPDLLSEPAKWIQRMIAEVEGEANELLGEGDEETIDVGEDEVEDLTVQPPKELTPLEKQGQDIDLMAYVEKNSQNTVTLPPVGGNVTVIRVCKHCYFASSMFFLPPCPFKYHHFQHAATV
jgi:hypothetical protein